MCRWPSVLGARTRRAAAAAGAIALSTVALQCVAQTAVGARFAFSLAISSTGRVALGRVGGLEVHEVGGSFVYSTGAGRTYTALARVPR